MIRFLSGKLKKHTKLAKIVKINIFVNRLVFPMNFNRFSHPMTVIRQQPHGSKLPTIHSVYLRIRPAGSNITGDKLSGIGF